MKDLNQKYSNRVANKIRKFLIKNYNVETCPIKFKVLETSDDFNIEEMEKKVFSKANKALFLEYFKYFESDRINLVKFVEKKETENEVNLRNEKEEKNIMNAWREKIEKEEKEKLANPKLKNKKIDNKPPVINLNKEPRVYNEIVVSNIDMSDSYCDFSKWVGSVFQSIKDLKVNDVEDVRKFFNIFLLFFIKFKLYYPFCMI